jgi:phosphoglycerate dehydrogenase-like enzyme
VPARRSAPFRNFDGLGDEAARVQVLITSWGCPRIDRAVVSTLPGLKLIAHLAGSVKGFIDENVWRMGVQITNAVAANAVPVAEYTLAAILFSNKHVLQLADFYRRNHENRAPWTKEAPNVGNYKKTVGLIGASHVGRKVLELLRPFDMKVLMYDPYMTPLQVRELGAHKVGLSELLSTPTSLDARAVAAGNPPHARRARVRADEGRCDVHQYRARGAVIDQQALEAE